MTIADTPTETRTIPGQAMLPGTESVNGAQISDQELSSLIQALLLVAVEPPTLDELAAVAEVHSARIEQALAKLADPETGGWFVQRHGSKIQLATAPRFATQVRTFLGLDREARLSSASLETLAIIAYQQPVTRTEIESLRGVDCSGVLATLHTRGLVEPVSRLATVGNPIQYGTTADFLKHFGIASLAELPPLGEISGQDGSALLEAALAINPEREEASEEVR